MYIIEEQMMKCSCAHIYIYTQDVPVRLELSGALGLGPWKRTSPDIIPKPTLQINRQSDVSPTRKPQNLVRFASYVPELPRSMLALIYAEFQEHQPTRLSALPGGCHNLQGRSG